MKKDDILQYLQQNPSEGYRSIARLFNTSHSYVIRIDRELKAEFKDIKTPQENDIWEYWEALKELADKAEKLDRKQTLANIHLKDDKPVGIAFTADWHLGAKGLDIENFEKDMNLLEETRGLYCIGLGDYKDNQNALVHPTGVQEQDFPSDMQDKVVKAWMERIVPLAVVRGCHDDWDKQISGKDFVDYICSDIEPRPYNLWHGGSINISLGTENYSMRVRHRIPNESNLNTENAFRRWYDRNGRADVLAAAHKHDPLVKDMYRQGHKVTYVRAGTYKKYDEFGQKLAGYVGTRACPVVILFPNEHRVVSFEELQDAIIFLRGVRV
jgi:hypothetical protein